MWHFAIIPNKTTISDGQEQVLGTLMQWERNKIKMAGNGGQKSG